MIASPEYDASIPGILKNAIDWTSRDEKAQYSSDPYKGKKIAIMSASPGKGGGARALVHLRTILQAVDGDVIKDQVSVPQAYKAFDAKGKLVSAETNKKLQEEVQQLLNSVPKSSSECRSFQKILTAVPIFSWLRWKESVIGLSESHGLDRGI